LIVFHLFLIFHRLSFHTLHREKGPFHFSPFFRPSLFEKPGRFFRFKKAKAAFSTVSTAPTTTTNYLSSFYTAKRAKPPQPYFSSEVI
jgi:hypothetical protein